MTKKRKERQTTSTQQESRKTNRSLPFGLFLRSEGSVDNFGLLQVGFDSMLLVFSVMIIFYSPTK